MNTQPLPQAVPNQLDPQWVTQIRREARQLEKDSWEHPNLDLHRRILQAWTQDSPQMMARLKAISPSFPTDLAHVLQARMWAMQKDLIESGMAATDAREQAERETLMLEPESQMDPDVLAEAQAETLGRAPL